jgi:hypothetical protein
LSEVCCRLYPSVQILQKAFDSDFYCLYSKLELVVSPSIEEDSLTNTGVH